MRHTTFFICVYMQDALKERLKQAKEELETVEK